MTDQEDFQRFARKLGLVIGVLIGWWCLDQLRDLVVLFLGAVVLSAALSPVIEVAEARGLRRSLTVLLIVAVVVALLGLLVSAILPPLIRQGIDLVNSLPALIAALSARVPEHSPLKALLPSASSISSALQSALSRGVSVALRAAGSIGNLVLVGLLTIMLTFDASSIMKVILRLLPEKQANLLEPYLPQMRSKLAGYVMGTLTTSAILAGGGFLVLKLLGIPYALLLSVILGIVAILPIVGGLIGILPAALVAVSVAPWRGLWTFVALFLMVQGVSNFVSPNIMRRTINIHPLVVIFAVTLGSRIGGLGGAIVSVPIAAALQVLVENLYLRPEVAEVPPAVHS